MHTHTHTWCIAAAVDASEVVNNVHIAAPVFVLCCVCCRSNIVVKATRKGLPVTEVCPGDNYTLSVSFSGDQRGALLTVSGGTLKGSNVPGW